MKERRLGRTDIKVRRVGFGGIPIQRVSESEAIKVVRRAHELGVNFFDTAIYLRYLAIHSACW